jgi:oxygen-independent coproporphyrinogen-3 oxidase
VLDRHAHAELAADFLVSHGYERIGIDHFAMPHDSMARAARAGTLRRNFQGYTVDAADALIGLGASSIGRLPQGFVQNIPSIGNYQRRVLAGELATERGVALTREDEVRAAAIEQVMCGLAFSSQALAEQFGADADPVIAEAATIAQDEEDGFVIPRLDGFAISEAGRPFARTIASRFDAYLPKRAARHSLAV